MSPNEILNSKKDPTKSITILTECSFSSHHTKQGAPILYFKLQNIINLCTRTKEKYFCYLHINHNNNDTDN